MLNTPFSPWPSFSAEEADVVSSVLLSNRVNYWTGSECKQFEQEFAAWIGADYAVALANGTVALDVALHALGIGEGDEVIVTPRSFIASASCVVNAGAIPVFADVDTDSQNITAETIRAVLTERTKAIICVHLAGWPCDMDPIMDLARQYDVRVIEDCAQAHGAIYKGRMVGSIGDFGSWSFCQDKIMTTGGEGGMLTTQDKELWSRAWSFKDHGKDWHALNGPSKGPNFRWLHESFGTNARMMEMQAAIGRIQLKRMPRWSEQRRSNAKQIAGVCRQSPALRVPETSAELSHAYYKFYAFVQPDKLTEGWSRNRIIEALNEQGVPCYQGVCPELYLEKAFSGSAFSVAERLENAKQLGETSLMFLVHPTLTADELEKTCAAISAVMQQAEA